MRTVFPRTVLERSLSMLESIESMLGPALVGGSEWSDRKNMIKRLIADCQTSNLEVVWLNKKQEFCVEGFYSSG